MEEQFTQTGEPTVTLQTPSSNWFRDLINIFKVGQSEPIIEAGETIEQNNTPYYVAIGVVVILLAVVVFKK